MRRLLSLLILVCVSTAIYAQHLVQDQINQVLSIQKQGTTNWPTVIKDLRPESNGSLKHPDAKKGHWVHIWSQSYFDEWLWILDVLSDGTIIHQQSNQNKSGVWGQHIYWELATGDPPYTYTYSNGTKTVYPAPLVTLRNLVNCVVTVDLSDAPSTGLMLENCQNVTVTGTITRSGNVRPGLFSAIHVKDSPYTIIRDMRISDCDSAAIRIDSADVTIQDTIITNVARKVADYGAVYVAGRVWKYVNFKILNSSITNSGWKTIPAGYHAREIQVGVYMDDYRSYGRIENCTFDNVYWGIFVSGGSYVAVHRSTFSATVLNSVVMNKHWSLDRLLLWDDDPVNDGYKAPAYDPVGHTIFKIRDMSKDGIVIGDGVRVKVTK